MASPMTVTALVGQAGVGGITPIRSATTGTLAAEVLSRSLVPYYLPEDMARILSLVKRAAEHVPFGELEFSREPGVSDLLRSIDAPSILA